MHQLRLERHDRAPRFVELRPRGTLLERVWGRIDGNASRSRTEQHANEEALRAAWSHQVRRLERKGYCAGRHHPELVGAIQANPGEAEAYLVYADWLSAQVDARGELIISMAADIDCQRLFDAAEDQLQPKWWAGWTKLDWRLGFLREVSCLGSDPSRVRRLLRHPSALALESLHVYWDRPEPEDWTHNPNTYRPSNFRDTWARCLRVAPPTLHRITFPSGEVLRPLVGEIPGVELVQREPWAGNDEAPPTTWARVRTAVLGLLRPGQ